MTYEWNDRQTDYMKFTEVELKKLKINEAKVAYKQFLTMLQPVFSGSVDHKVNLGSPNYTNEIELGTQFNELS